MITYNHEKNIEEIIDGVLLQKFNEKVGLIIAGDNSPDNTKKFLKDVI